MNEKEAIKIYYGFNWSQKRCGSCEPNYCRHPEAFGYLKGINKAKGLEEALIKIKINSERGVVQSTDYATAGIVAKEALVRWGKEK